MYSILAQGKPLAYSCGVLRFSMEESRVFLILSPDTFLRFSVRRKSTIRTSTCKETSASTSCGKTGSRWVTVDYVLTMEPVENQCIEGKTRWVAVPVTVFFSSCSHCILLGIFIATVPSGTSAFEFWISCPLN